MNFKKFREETELLIRTKIEVSALMLSVILGKEDK